MNKGEKYCRGIFPASPMPQLGVAKCGAFSISTGRVEKF